jgi:hypothetical protein
VGELEKSASEGHFLNALKWLCGTAPEKNVTVPQVLFFEQLLPEALGH